MDEIKSKKTLIISRQILLYFMDFFRLTLPIFDKANFYRIPLKKYDKFRSQDKIKFSKTLYRLKSEGFVKKYFDGKNEYLELMPKGQKLIGKHIIEELEIESPLKWDRKWRIVIYDIANDKKNEREAIKRKLENIGFLKLQESVFVYPFDCLDVINLIKGLYFLTPYVQYIVAERIESERDLIKEFYDREILTDQHL